MKKPEKQKRREIVLPPCGLLVGCSVYVTQADYLTCSGRVHTTWVPQSFSLEMMRKKFIEDNQGNFILLWGPPANRPLATYYWCGLDQLGVKPPESDWEKRRCLTTEEWLPYHQYAGRYGAGMPDFVKQAGQHGSDTSIIYAPA
ncbi:MAG: hypothetical protein NC911_04120, partial [Candidatus Omnitrophica bacterium]|nr:hypothetical protein [Candidatus Omnitrophota bacterium]